MRSSLHPTIGAEVEGIDLSKPISDGVRDESKTGLLKWKVLFFRNQTVNRRQHLDFAKRFGSIYTPPYEKIVWSTWTASPACTSSPPIPGRKSSTRASGPGIGYDGYHSDTNWRIVPSWGAVLRAVNQPPVGGDTIWVDAGKVYRELPEELKKRFEGLHSIVDFRAALQRAGHDYSWWPTPSSAPTARRAKRSSGSTSANTPRSSASPRQRTARSSA